MSGLSEADRATVLGWVADALGDLDRTSPVTAVPRLLYWASVEAAATKPAPLVPEVGKLYEFDALRPDKCYPSRTHVGWWNGRDWVGCFDRGMWSPQLVTGFRPYNPVAEPVPVDAATREAIAADLDADHARWLEHYTRRAQQEMPYPAGFLRGLERAANRARSFGSRVLAAETEGQQQ